MAYSGKKIEKMLKQNLLYRKECINYRGKSEEREHYIEFISRYIKDNIGSLRDELKYNESIIKEKFIYPHSRENMGKTKPNSNKYEAHLCRDLYKNGFDLGKLGNVVEYEANIVIGNRTNIDLVSYNKDTGILYLIEVKGKNNNGKYDADETLLRCILEISTYYNSIFPKIEKFKKDMETVTNAPIKKVSLAILVPRSSAAYQEYLDKETYVHTNSLLDKPIIVNDSGIDKIQVFSFEECNIPLEVGALSN